MGRAAQFFAPDLTTNGVLNDAATKYGWNAGDIQEAQDWYNHFLEAAWNAEAKGDSINVINRKADDLWHVHKDTQPAYDDYCNSCFGKPVNHIPVPSPHAPSGAELSKVRPYYGPNWPIPDSMVSCSS